MGQTGIEPTMPYWREIYSLRGTPPAQLTHKIVVERPQLATQESNLNTK